MGWSEEFGKLHTHYKIVLASIALQMPFWYVVLFLFPNRFVELDNSYILFPICFCLAITWYMFFFLITLLVDFIKNDKSTVDNQLVVACTLGMLFIAMFSFRSLYFDSSVPSLKYFLFNGYTGMGFTVILFAIVAVCVGIYRKHKKKKEKPIVPHQN
jgi:hypothetical protein